MLDKTINGKNPNQHLLKKNSSSKSCQSLLCLTQQCKQDQQKQKQRTLSYQFFQKLSLKKFNQPSFLNNSSYQKAYIPLIKDQSKDINQFENIVLNHQQNMKFSIGDMTFKHKVQGDQETRIQRSSSQKMFHRPQLITTDRSIQQQLQKDVRKIHDLQHLRNKLQSEIKQLDHNIDKYYLIYNSKIQELKNIQSKMSEINVQQKLQKIPSSDELRSFKKKPVDNSPTYKIAQYNKHFNNSTLYSYNKNSPPNYFNTTINTSHPYKK